MLGRVGNVKPLMGPKQHKAKERRSVIKINVASTLKLMTVIRQAATSFMFLLYFSAKEYSESSV